MRLLSVGDAIVGFGRIELVEDDQISQRGPHELFIRIIKRKIMHLRDSRYEHAVVYISI